ncbi:MAG: TonB-dependent receptor [Bacteroidota bacterium]
MNQKFTTYTYLAILLFSLCGISVSGQTGSIRGTVYDTDGKETLIGANVVWKQDASKGTATEFDGTYLLEDIPVGTQTISFSYTGYDVQDIEVLIEEGKTSVVNISLSLNAVAAEEIIVTAQALGQARAIKQQINSETIANIVSADRIQELPDVNAAEAISRLPGIAVNRSGGEGQKVVIRGMAPKFAAITVNGIRMPSNSGTDRSVDLSLISPELLDGIEVFKSPLPDMDAEAVGGTVNLRLRKAPKDFQLLVKGLGGFNEWNDDFRDYKGVVQGSKRIFNDKLGVVFQGSVERFNRGGDFLTNRWEQGPTNDSTGVTEILGLSLRLEDRLEIRKRQNASLALDYDLGKNSFSFFGLYSRTSRDRSSMQENYLPNEPAITFVGSNIENELQLTSFSLLGEHLVGKSTIDWAVATSESRGETPYNFEMLFENTNQVFGSDLNTSSHPRNYYGSATPDLATTYLRSANFFNSLTKERTNTFALNFKLPFSLSDKVKGYFKTGGKYISITRSRDEDQLSEDFYYLGGDIGRDAIAASSSDLILLPNNNDLISILTFAEENNDLEFVNESNENIGLKASLNEGLMRQWYADQQGLLNENREVIVNRYEVEETVTAGYAMLKFEIGKRLSIIPGVRYEYSDNEYRSGISTLNGRYGVNGTFTDTTTTQTYGEVLPHLHVKYQALDWLDIRASYATTLARPDFNFVTPRSSINDNTLVIVSGNPDLRHAKAQNLDLFVSAYKNNWGLLSAGVFYKRIDDIFYDWRTNLFDQETADQFGWSSYKGYELRSYINSGESTVRGFELDFQTNFRFLPRAFNGLVLNINYARLYSQTESFFLTSETIFISQVPPIPQTTFTNNVREVPLPSQAPHVLNLSLGYDRKKFSFRISGTYQGTQASGYSSNKDFDRFILSFWRWDASIKQRFRKNWSAFFNLNNFTNQQDISFTRTEAFRNTVETYGMTGTIGLQYRIK